MRIAALLLSIVVAGAQPDRNAERLRDWIQAVDRHDVGASDEPLATICVWTDSELSDMRAFLESFVGAPAKNEMRRRRLANLTSGNERMIREAQRTRLGNDPTGFKRHAAMLHTDAALNCPPPAIGAPPSTLQPPKWARQPSDRRVDVLGYDADPRGLEMNNLHWQIAMDMLDALPPTPADPFIARWYAAIGAHFLWQHRYSDALDHFDRARTIVSNDPAVLYYEARLHETLSGPSMQNFIRTSLAKGTPVGGIDNMRSELNRAETLLQRALTGNPSLVAARLRLGRVVMQQQRWEEGLGHVRKAAADTTKETELYFAYLFSGDAQLALGKPDDARQSYEQALTFFPDAQSPRLGLAAAIRAYGEAADAITAILPTLELPSDGRGEDDPWWQYYNGREDEVAALLDELRAPFVSRQ